MQMCESAKGIQVTCGVWREDDMWGGVGDETGTGLRTPTCKANKLVFYPGGIKE